MKGKLTRRLKKEITKATRLRAAVTHRETVRYAGKTVGGRVWVATKMALYHTA